MEYGILVAEQKIGETWGGYQIIGSVSSIAEAREMAANYMKYGPNNGLLAPDLFVIRRRDEKGWYTRREPFGL
jgi:adenylylsulfate kinase-like enzyme